MNRWILVATAVAALWIPTTAIADGGNGHVNPESGGFTAMVTHHYSGHYANSSAAAEPIANPAVPTVDIGTYLFTGFCAGTNWTEACTPVPAPEPPAGLARPTLTPGLVASAFEHLPLPASDLEVQPPGGRTLVNFETNFYTENGEFTRTVTLLGQQVELRIWPASYGWRFGDGATTQTSSPGSAYPDLEITHRYLSAGEVRASVDTTYAAEFRVNGAAWRDVDGTVTIPGAPEGLRVVTARPVLVGD